MTEQREYNPDEYENLPEDEKKEVSFFISIPDSISMISNIQFISSETGINPYKVFSKALDLGFRAEEYKNEEDDGLYKRLVCSSERWDLGDDRFGVEIPVRDDHIYSPIEDPIQTYADTTDFKKVETSAEERGIPTEDLVIRAVRLGILVMEDLLDGEEFYIRKTSYNRIHPYADEEKFVEHDPIDFRFIHKDNNEVEGFY